MSARDEILARVRAGLGRSAANREAALERVRAALAAPAAGPRPPVEGDLAARLRAQAERMASSVDTVATLAEAPAAVARYLAAAGLPGHGVVWPALGYLDWGSAGLVLEPRSARDDDPVGVTGCFCAIAETGTLMTCSSPGSPAATSLLPPTHVALVPRARIVPTMEDAWALARAELGVLPRAVNFISGPSRTGDIELTIVLGVHGPQRVHIVLVEQT